MLLFLEVVVKCKTGSMWLVSEHGPPQSSMCVSAICFPKHISTLFSASLFYFEIIILVYNTKIQQKSKSQFNIYF